MRPRSEPRMAFRPRATSHRWAIPWVASLFLLTLAPLPAGAQGVTVSVGVVQDTVAITPGTFPISHVVFVVMENHAYDNYYGVYCQKVGTNCPVAGNGIPPGTCVNMTPGSSAGGCVRPFALNASFVLHSDGAGHNWLASHTSYDNGLMDGFYQAAGHSKNVLGYYNGTTLPTYWDMAEQFGLGDNFFSSALSFSLPNHWFAVAAQAPVASEDPPGGTYPQLGTAQPLTGTEMQYLNESNATPALDDEIVNTSGTWKYYDYGLQNGSYDYAVNQTVLGNASFPSIFDYWNPLIAKAESWGPGFASHFVPRDQFFNDTANGSLPQLSWIIPGYYQSDHPADDLNNGEAFIASILGALQNSSEWKSTAVFVTWDEYGGYYDHVAPPQLDAYGLGFRVPLLVFSPYTPEGYISPTFTSFESVLRFMEWRYSLQNLSYRDGLANLPLDFFDINATARAPDPIAYGTPYPMKEQIQALKRVSGLSVTTSTAGATLSWKEAAGGAPVASFLVKYWATKPAVTTLQVPRTQSSLAIGKLRCNTTYNFQVTESAGNSHSSPVIVSATTGACVAVPFNSLSYQNSVPGAVGDRARSVPMDVREARPVRRPRLLRPEPRPRPAAAASPSLEPVE